MGVGLVVVVDYYKVLCFLYSRNIYLFRVVGRVFFVFYVLVFGIVIS